MGGKVKNNISDKRPYKVYTALLNQVGTSAPTAEILENTIGNIVWSREGIGRYNANLINGFPINKTHSIGSSTDASAYLLGVSSNNSADNVVFTNSSIDGTLVDGLYSVSIEIRVYN
jgi:hypothetical protein